jgi:Flagellar biosynthesis protein, FliO
LEILPQLIAVLFVFALLGGLLWWLRRRGAAQIAPMFPFRLTTGKTGPGKLLQRIEALQLSPTHALNLVRMGDRAILVGTSPAGFHVVESAPWKSIQAKESEA